MAVREELRILFCEAANTQKCSRQEVLAMFHAAKDQKDLYKWKREAIGLEDIP